MNTWIEEDPETGKRIEKTLHIQCPECNTENPEMWDEVTEELYCYHCGLVLEAPPVYGLVFPGLLYVVEEKFLD